MQNWFERIQMIHALLAREAFYSLLLGSFLACGILAVRIHLSETWRYYLLLWNLFLAWVPYFSSLYVLAIHQYNKGRQWLLLAFSLLWLLFFPNAPYLVTDLIYLRQETSFPLWYDVGLMATFAWNGCFLAIASLNMMQRVVKSFTGRVISWLFVLGIFALSGMGIYLGRFQRWNSWDLLRHPEHILIDLVTLLIHPTGNLQAIGITMMFAAFLFICYLTFIMIRPTAPTTTSAFNLNLAASVAKPKATSRVTTYDTEWVLFDSSAEQPE